LLAESAGRLVREETVLVSRTTTTLRSPSAERTAGVERGYAQRPTILAVDDEPDALGYLRVGLSGVGFDVLEATNGVAALSLVEQRRPDLMIVDVMMPGMSGFELCARLRLREDTRDLPIILYSAFPMRHSNAGLYQRAFVKPANLEELLYAIRTLLPEEG
jgi:two-component system, OmpR family, phosphate regulon response regulator PhoB